MRQLDSGTHALRLDEAGDALQLWNVGIFPDAQVGGGDPAFRQDGGCLKREQAWTALSAGAEMHKMPIAGEAVSG